MNYTLTLREAVIITLKRRGMSKQALYRMLRINDNNGAELIRGLRPWLESKAAEALGINPELTQYNLSLAEACLLFRVRNNLTIPELNTLWKTHYAGHLEAGFPVPHKHLVKISENLGYVSTLPTVPDINSIKGMQCDDFSNQ